MQSTNPRQKEDKRLIKRIVKKQDQKAADRLIRAYYDEIYAYAFKQVFDKEMAMDLTQDIFIRMLKGLSHYDDQKASFRTWLYRLTTNLLIDYMRKQKRVSHREKPLDDFYLVDDSEPLMQVANRETLSLIMDYVNNQAYDSQQIFQLKIFAEMSFKEISALLQLKESTVKSKYYRLIQAIKERFIYEN